MKTHLPRVKTIKNKQMRRILFLLLVSSAALVSQAQDYAPIKTLLTLGQYQKAKEDVDKNMGNAKFTSKAEAYMLKSAIYAALAMDNANKNTPTGAQLANDAEAAFRKYKEMDASMALLADPIYQNGPINLYSFFYSVGYSDYSAKRMDAGFDKLRKAVDMSDVLLAKKIIVAPIDTNVLILAAITAESSKHSDDAARYYTRLADAKIAGKDYESVYRYLVNY
jgi:hypothetical protein